MNQTRQAQSFLLYNWNYKKKADFYYHTSDIGCQFQIGENKALAEEITSISSLATSVTTYHRTSTTSLVAQCREFKEVPI